MVERVAAFAFTGRIAGKHCSPVDHFTSPFMRELYRMPIDPVSYFQVIVTAEIETHVSQKSFTAIGNR
jgi:hypothetical protein